ncbi:hypothetical protein [Chryseobacterium sp. MFBS3-17]|uniref:hypothetical protein n=1 Tax=Chryseobacterium sp. MFBS3-17 TaxID=2886689 RepID=UPI001D0EF535|nr:hypothetical protein [Chryseobacterium sp. MFBS3-17]MCC2590329.1 hypothetical protein [Chryseobacterium sp. MFBS3-17]
MPIETKIKRILPGAKVRVDCRTEVISVAIGSLDAVELKMLLRHGLTEIKRSGSGLSLKFKTK